MKRARILLSASLIVASAAFLSCKSSNRPATPIQLKMKEIDKIFQFVLGALPRHDSLALVGQGAQMAALIESVEVSKAAPYAASSSWQEQVESFARECRNFETNAGERNYNEMLVSWDGVKTTCKNCHGSFRPRP